MTGLLAVALDAHDAVSAGTDEQQRLEAIRVLAVHPEDRPHKRALIPLLGHIDEQLATLAPYPAEIGARVDEPQSEAVSLLQQRPQLHAVAATKVERFVGAVAVVIGGPSVAHAMDGVQLPDQHQVIGAVLPALDLPRLQPIPRQGTVDPAAACAFSHQPRQQPRRAAAARKAARVQRQLKRQRFARRRLRRRCVDQPT